MSMRKTRKFLTILSIFTTIFACNMVPTFAAENNETPKVEGTSVIMIDGTTGDVLYDKNSQERRDPASVTKILTCLVVLENMDLNQEITVMEDSSPVGHNIEMKKGEKLTVEQLLYALMLPSANDAARVLAKATAGDIKSFSKMMNDRAKECGATSTTFTNPNGLNVAGQENHKTTAEDLSKITQEALRNEKFRELVTTTTYTILKTNKSDERVLKSTNALLQSKKSVKANGKSIPLRYEWATGVKTGTTSVAGNCFVGSAKKGSTELIVVTLNSGDKTRFTDAIQLFDYGFANYKTKVIAKTEDPLEKTRVKRGTTGSIGIGTAKDLAVTLRKGQDGKTISRDITTEVKLNEETLTAPIDKGQVVGTVTLLDENKQEISKADAVALATVKEGGPLSRIGIPDDMVPLVIVTLFTIGLIVIVIMGIKRRNV